MSTVASIAEQDADGRPQQFNITARGPSFFAKLVCLFLAGLNVVVLYATGVFRTVESLAARDDAPALAKLIAATWLFLWIGVIYFGRMLPYIGSAF